MTTNITEEHKAYFEALHKGMKGFALFSCFVNGEPTSAIALVVDDGEGGVIVRPMFVAVTEDMVLTDHAGMRTEIL